MGDPRLVTITVNGVAHPIPKGLISFQDLVQAAKLPLTTKQLTVVSTVTQATSIKGNASYTIVGGEVFTSI